MNDKRPISRVDRILQNAANINRQQGRIKQSYKPPCAAERKENLQTKNKVHLPQQLEVRRSTRQPKVSRRLFDVVISFILSILSIYLYELPKPLFGCVKLVHLACVAKHRMGQKCPCIIIMTFSKL